METVVRAHRVELDPTVQQRQSLERHAGANRAAFNWHLGVKLAAMDRRRQEAAWATYTDPALVVLDPAEAATRAWKLPAVKAIRVPGYMASAGVFVSQVEWASEVNRYALTSGMRAADEAVSRWLTGLARRPKFKSKRRPGRVSFTLFHDKKLPGLRLAQGSYRRFVLPAKVAGPGRSIRLKGNLRRLGRRIARGSAVVSSVTISRQGSRWYLSVLAEETIEIAPAPTARQRAAGVVGVDVGVRHLATASDGTVWTNPALARRNHRRVAAAQRSLARTRWVEVDHTGTPTGVLISSDQVRRGMRLQPTAGRVKARARLAALQHKVRMQRSTAIHTMTKRLATSYAVVGMEDLNVAGMTRSAAGSLEQPGRNVAAKAGLNRSILDAGFGEIRRQLTYKTHWYRSSLVLTDRWAPTSKTCSTCGTMKPKLALAERTYSCAACGMVADRDLNAARNIATLATPDARGQQESSNAGRASPATTVGEAMTPEGQDHTAPATATQERVAHPTQHSTSARQHT